MRVGSDYQANIPDFEPGNVMRLYAVYSNLTDWSTVVASVHTALKCS